MGCSFGFSRSTHDSKPQEVVVKVETVAKTLPNPNPKNYNVVKIETVGDLVVLLVHYPNCINYEGNKIIVMTADVYLNCTNTGTLDPHFCENKNYCPIARFSPDMWDVAVKFAQMQDEKVKEYNYFFGPSNPPQYWLDYYKLKCDAYKHPVHGEMVYVGTYTGPARALSSMKSRNYCVVSATDPIVIEGSTFRKVSRAIDNKDSRLIWKSTSGQWLENVDLTNQTLAKRHEQWLKGNYRFQ